MKKPHGRVSGVDSVFSRMRATLYMTMSVRLSDITFLDILRHNRPSGSPVEAEKAVKRRRQKRPSPKGNSRFGRRLCLGKGKEGKGPRRRGESLGSRDVRYGLRCHRTLGQKPSISGHSF